MDESALQSNINCVKEMILDENKLVTYMSISKDLCLHVNESKSLLSQIVDNIRKQQPNIDFNVNYIISGLIDKNKALTTVCTEADLDGVKKSLKTIFFQHIYSVGKGPASADGVAYMAINRFEDFPLCTGLIKSNRSTKRTLDEIGNLKSNSQEIAVVDMKSIIPQKKIKEENNKTISIAGISHKNNVESKERMTKKVNGELSSVVKVHETKSEPVIKTENSSPKKDRKNQNKAQKGIAGFFNKSNSVPAKKPKNDLNKDAILRNNLEKESIQVKDEKMDVQDLKTTDNGTKKEHNDKDKLKSFTGIKKNGIDSAKESIQIKDEQMDVEDLKTTVNVTKKEHSDKQKLKSLTGIKKNGKVDKKRKRVLHVSDSESEDEKNDPFRDDNTVANKETIESDDEIPPTPTVNTVKITSGIVNPRKRRKIVDKTYTDEDGYILTKKEEIYESCSENEMELDPKEKENVKQINHVKTAVSPIKKNGTKNKKKFSPPQKGKQATLMNFFKKV